MQKLLARIEELEKENRGITALGERQGERIKRLEEKGVATLNSQPSRPREPEESSDADQKRGGYYTDEAGFLVPPDSN